MNPKDIDLLSELKIHPAQRNDGGPRKRWPWILGGAVILLAIAITIGGLVATRSQVITVETANAEPIRALTGSTAVLDATGYVTARREATVSSKITGKLAEVLIEEGDYVEQGQVLARLDNADEKAQLDLAKAQAAATKAQVGELEAQLLQAKRDLVRQQELNTKGLTTQQAVEDARTKLDSLDSQLHAQRKQIDVADAQSRIAQVNFDNTIIRAPFSGVVVAKAAQPGEIVSPMSAGGGYTRTGICTIVDMDSLEIEVDVNEAYINRVKPKQPVIAVLNAYPDWKIPAEVIAIIPTADRAKATVRVRIALKQKDVRIVPDMGIRVSFFDEPPQTSQSGSLRGVLIPATAIVQRDGQSIVFVVNGGRVHRRPVTPGANSGDLRIIDQGLQVGEQVVKEPPTHLKDGMQVKLKTGV